MNKFYRLYIIFGKILFWVLLPIERFFIRRTHRVYGLIIKYNKVLLTKNWLSDGKWALPGGGVKKAESSAESLKRELHEELSIDLGKKPLKIVKSGHWRNHNFGFSYDIYEIDPKIDFKINRKLEITDVAWVNITDLSIATTAIDTLDILANFD
jgi:8-oxo-dGTP pyrophosphatase MutT (NUDIX family)